VHTLDVMTGGPTEGADRDALVAAVYRDKAAVLRGLARGITRDGESADDVVQEAFVRTLRARRAPADPDQLFYYLVRVVLNLTRSRAARTARRDRAHPRPAGGPHDGPGTSPPGAVAAAVARLPRRQREVVYLRFWLDLGVEATADVLGMSAGSVKTHSSRAVDALRRDLPSRLEEDHS
jgi:DNA-directed RNA polymerase specialized sigma24 family protein